MRAEKDPVTWMEAVAATHGVLANLHAHRANMVVTRRTPVLLQVFSKYIGQMPNFSKNIWFRISASLNTLSQLMTSTYRLMFPIH